MAFQPYLCVCVCVLAAAGKWRASSQEWDPTRRGAGHRGREWTSRVSPILLSHLLLQETTWHSSLPCSLLRCWVRGPRLPSRQPRSPARVLTNGGGALERAASRLGRARPRGEVPASALPPGEGQGWPWFCSELPLVSTWLPGGWSLPVMNLRRQPPARGRCPLLLGPRVFSCWLHAHPPSEIPLLHGKTLGLHSGPPSDPHRTGQWSAFRGHFEGWPPGGLWVNFLFGHWA